MGSATEELLRLLPELGARLNERDGVGSVSLTTVPERRQARMLEGILGVLGRLGERRPVLLVIEDLHRADAGTRTLATFLARIARLQRLAIVGDRLEERGLSLTPSWAPTRPMRSGATTRGRSTCARSTALPASRTA